MGAQTVGDFIWREVHHFFASRRILCGFLFRIIRIKIQLPGGSSSAKLFPWLTAF
jgi:hypothetical protein